MAGTGTGAPPAAWYPDPGRRHEYRWWDGARWTEHVSNRQVLGRDPLPPRPAQSPVAPTAPVAPAHGAGEELRFEPGAWLEAYSVFLRRSPGQERGIPMSFDVRDAGGTPLLSVVSVPALGAANASRRRAGAAGSDLLLVTPADVPVARLARSGPSDHYVLLHPGGGVLGWAAVAPDADPLSRGGLSVGLTLGTEAAAPPWARLRMLGADAGEGEITTTSGLLVATTTIDAPDPPARKKDAPVEHRLSYRTDITPPERLLTVVALIALDLAHPLAR